MSKTTKINNTDDPLNKRSLDEIFEKLDKHDQEMEELTKKVDSLDKNLNHLKEELELLKSKQVSQEELAKAIDNYFNKSENNSEKKSGIPAASERSVSSNKVDKQGQYKVISPKTESEFESLSDSSEANYKIVLGVYQLGNYAKEYQKFLQRQLGYESKLVQLPDHPKKFIYVCSTKEYTNLKEALGELRITRKTVKSKSVEITKGEAWILQTTNR